MKYKYKGLVTAFLALWLVVGVTSCSDDNSTGAEQEDCNISLPTQFTAATVDQSYFSEQTEPDPQDPQYSTYFEVQSVGSLGSSFFAGGASPFAIATALLTYAQISDVSPDFENGSCVWTISPPPSTVDGQDLTVTINGTATSSGVNWEIVYNGELGEGEVEDFTIVTGSTSDDSQSGEWNYFVPENTSSPALTYTWTIESEDDFELNVTSTPSEFGVANIDYDKTGVENSLTFNSGDEIIDVYWNEETDSGWIDDSESQRCYTNFVNSDCP